jgi:hypothetical protein
MVRDVFRRLVLWSVLAASTTGANCAFATGEAVNGFPNWSERVLIEWMNRARSDPQADLAGCPSGHCLESACYSTASPPRYETDDLEHSSRYHSAEMELDGFFDHWSECTLVSNIATLYLSQPQQCDGTASCACVGGARNAGFGNGTDPFTRMGFFGTGGGAAGEIIAAGYQGPDAAFYGWLYEQADSSTCVFDEANGHRYLILTDGNGQNAGAGYVPGGDYGTYATMDFAGNASAQPKIPSGAHYPEQAASVDVWANWYDSAGPSVHQIDVDGTCTNLSLARGSQANGAWHATISGVGSGCHRYFFSFEDSNGQTVFYPTTGSLAIGNGGAQCPDWSTTMPAPCVNEIFANGFEL